jgi:hypothetical protein
VILWLLTIETGRLHRGCLVLGGVARRKPPMNKIIEAIEAEIQRLQAGKALLGEETNAHEVGKPVAQNARWAKAKSGEVMDGWDHLAEQHDASIRFSLNEWSQLDEQDDARLDIYRGMFTATWPLG